MPKKVLIFTYYWPPAGGPGVQRFLKFVKYLPSFNWTPIIITPENGSYPYIDNSLIQEIPEDLRVIKTKTRDPFKIYNFFQGKKGKNTSVGMIGLQNEDSFFKRMAKYVRANFFIPDARVGWNKFALKAARKLLQQEKIDCIITTGPPHSTHLIGLKIKQGFNIPWLADFRDPWTNMYYNNLLPQSSATKKRQKQLENKILKTADSVTVVTPGLAEEFDQKANEISIIYNGYDEEDFTTSNSRENGSFSLIYTGNFKPSQNIRALWEALNELIHEENEFARYFHLKITGQWDPEIEHKIELYNLDSFTTFQPFISHSEAIEEMSNASILLFIIPFVNNRKSILTGKIFEYIATKRPILTIAPPEGNIKDLYEEAQIPDPILDYENKTGIKTFIRKKFRDFLQKGYVNAHYNTNPAIFSRKKLTKKLADKLDNINAKNK